MMLPPDMKHFTGHNSYSYIKSMSDITSGSDDHQHKEEKHAKHNQKHTGPTGNINILKQKKKKSDSTRTGNVLKQQVVKKKRAKFVRKQFYFLQ